LRVLPTYEFANGGSDYKGTNSRADSRAWYAYEGADKEASPLEGSDSRALNGTDERSHVRAVEGSYTRPDARPNCEVWRRLLEYRKWDHDHRRQGPQGYLEGSDTRAVNGSYEGSYALQHVWSDHSAYKRTVCRSYAMQHLWTNGCAVGCAFEGPVEGTHTRPDSFAYTLFYMRTYEGSDRHEDHGTDQGSDASISRTFEGAVDGSDA